MIPLIVFIGATWFVYDRGVRRNGGFERLGQIRLNDQDFDDGFNPIENNQVDAVVNKIVKGGVYTAAVIFATFKTVQKVDRMVLEKLVMLCLDVTRVLEITFLFLMKMMICLVILMIMSMKNWRRGKIKSGAI